MNTARRKSRPPRRPQRTDISAIRRFYARYITASMGIDDERIVTAFATVPREDFVGPGPWQVQVASGYILTGTDDPIVLYQNILVALAAERSLNNGQPTLHATSIATANPRAGDLVVHVGAGTGYYTAILAELVGPRGRIEAYEIDRDLAGRAQESLARYPNVQVRQQSALAAELPAANVVYVSAGATHVPPAWLDALAIGGRLVLPLTPDERLGCMLLVTRKSAGGYAARIFLPAKFIDCIGARDAGQSRVLAAALDAGGADNVRSLHRDALPDASAWCVGEGWWLSTDEMLYY